MDELSQTFSALSDPTRRAILVRLAQGPATVNELAVPFQMTQQAVSKHLAYLEKASLIEKKKAGRQQVCVLRPDAFDPMKDWILACQSFWAESFARLAELVEKEKGYGE
ncbi:MAG TPA: metalloregulator ArsR/SmtB family transcription factor [Bryobacteraceae bacterium]|nr:metalloregulator ArsR/SmtB family transcription factor [Bryobacteraceae bacterium]